MGSSPCGPWPSWEGSGRPVLLLAAPGRCRTRLLVPVAGAGGKGPHGPLLAPQVRAFLQHPLKGVVMETFGSGNGPTKPDLLQELRAATERGLVIVNCTHCLQGAVTSDYAAGMVGVGKPRPGEGASWAVTPAPHFPHMPPSPRPWREPA